MQASISSNIRSSSCSSNDSSKKQLSPSHKNQTVNSINEIDLTDFKQILHFQSENLQNKFKYFQSIDLKIIIKELKDKGGLEKNKLQLLLDINAHILKNQPNVLNIISPVVIVGDIHGQFFDLLNIFEIIGFPDNKKFLFLGINTQLSPKATTLIVGCSASRLSLYFFYSSSNIQKIYSYQEEIMKEELECQKKYGIDIYQRFLEVFCNLPLCAVVDHSYFAVHGGISPEINKISTLVLSKMKEQIEKISRIAQIQNKGLICDLMWSDPSQNTANQWEPNALRGCSYYYSKAQAKKFLKDNQIQMIIRGHQVQIQGYNYQKTNTNEKLTLTIFSAPNYCDSYKNKGAVAIISPNKISIQRYSEVAHPFILANYMNLFQFSIPGVSQLVGKLFLFLLKNRTKRSRKQSLIDDKLLEQLDALRRIQLIQHIIQQRKQQNQDVLLQTSLQSNDSLTSQDLMKSFQLASHMFLQKKVNDHEEMYPTQHTLQMRNRKRTLTKKYKLYNVFGPKLQMKNNICKKLISGQVDDFATLEE